jgi:hypothetical protein
MCIIEKKNAGTNDSSVFMCIIEKKNARNNNSGGFMCIIEKKMPKLMIPVVLYVNGKKKRRN